MRLLPSAQFIITGEQLVKGAVLSFSRLLFALHLEILPLSSSMAVALFLDASFQDPYLMPLLIPEVPCPCPVTSTCENVTFVQCLLTPYWRFFFFPNKTAFYFSWFFITFLFGIFYIHSYFIQTLHFIRSKMASCIQWGSWKGDGFSFIIVLTASGT